MRGTFFLHPRSVCMTYREHARFSLSLAWTFAVASLASVVHAVWPDVLQTHASDTVAEVRERMKRVGCRDVEV